MNNLTVLEGFAEAKKQNDKNDLIKAFKELSTMRRDLIDSGIPAKETDALLSIFLSASVMAANNK